MRFEFRAFPGLTQRYDRTIVLTSAERKDGFHFLFILVLLRFFGIAFRDIR